MLKLGNSLGSRSIPPAFNWIVDPLVLNPFLYYDGSENVTTAGGAVSSWGERSAGTNQLDRTLAQGTASLQPDNTTEKSVDFDGTDDRLEFDVAVAQAGILITATSNGIFAYEIAADSVTIITALGPLCQPHAPLYFDLDLFAMVLLPTTVTDTEIAGVIKYLERETGATRNPTGNITGYLMNRPDVVALKFDALDFSGVTGLNGTWNGTSDMPTFPSNLDLSNVTDFYTAWWNGRIVEFPALDLSSGTTFSHCFGMNSAMTSWGACNVSNGTNFYNAWYYNTALTSFPVTTFSTDPDDDINFGQAWINCTALTSFPALNLSRGTSLLSAWYGCTAMTSFGSCTFSNDAGDSISFSSTWRNTGLTSFPSDVDLSRGNTFFACWYTTPIVNFPALDLSAGSNFSYAFGNNASMTTFGACTMTIGTDFGNSWNGNSSLTTFPAGLWDNWSPSNPPSVQFNNSWSNCTALTEQSVENILVSIAESGVGPNSYPTLTIDSNNVDVNDLNAAIRAACTALQSRGWNVVINGSIVNEYSMHFNGTDEYVVTGLTPDFIHTGATLSYWVKMDNFTGFQVMGCFTSGEPTTYFYLGFYGTNINWGVHSTYKNSVDVSSYVSVGSWHHLCMVATGGAVTVYIDGVSRDTGTYTPAEASNPTSPLAIGAVAGPSIVDPMEGDIDEVAIWDEALDADAVTAVYNSGQPINLNREKGNYDNEGDLISWWRMGDNDSGAGTTVTDNEGSNDGTLVNDPLFVVDTPPNYSNYALEFNGTNEYGTSSADSTLASKSYSFWAKSTKTTWNGIFSHDPSELQTRFDFNASSSKPSLNLGTDYYRYWADNSAQDDGAWHHHVVYVEHDDITNCKWYVDGVVQTTDYTVSSGSANAYTSGLTVGNIGSSYFDGSLDEFAIFDGELTSAQINTIFNGGAPADLDSLSPENWWRMGEDDSGAGATITDQGSEEEDLTLVNTPTYVRTTPNEDATYNNRSISFNGTDEYANTSYVVPAISTLTISAWFKHDGTKGGNQFIISDWGAAGSWAQSGRGLLGFYGKTVMIVMSDGINYYYARSADTYDASAFFDDAWHHAVITIDTETQKFYLDGALVHTHDTTDAGTRTGGTSAVLGTAGTNIEVIGRAGSYAGDYWEGSIDEVAIWESVLSAAQVLAIYNGGVPFDISEFSPVSWWRMGEDDAEGTIITNLAFATGSDLVTNGDFASDANWTKGTGWSISGGKASCDGTQTGNTVLKQQSGVEGVTLDLEVGSLYEITFEVVAVSAGAITYVEVGSDTEHTDYSTPQTVVQYHTPTSTNDRISIAGDSTFVGSIDNVVVKKVGGSPAVLVNAPTWSTDTP